MSSVFEEMKDALDIRSRSGVHRRISALEERGFLRRLPNRARALEVLRQPENVATRKAANDVAPAVVPPRMPEPANDVIEIPLHGRIAPGAPIEAPESDPSLPLPAPLPRTADPSALHASGG